MQQIREYSQKHIAYNNRLKRGDGCKLARLPLDHDHFLQLMGEGKIVYYPDEHRLVVGNPLDKIGLPIDCPPDYFDDNDDEGRILKVELHGRQTVSWQNDTLLWLGNQDFTVCFDITFVTRLYNMYITNKV